MPSEESFVYTACPGWGDHDYCVLKTIVKEGEIVRTEKAEYPNKRLGNAAHICQKGLESCKQPYNKERIIYPLKRTGERGEGQWKRISWDQAMDEIADKLNAIREEHGPEALAFWNFIASVPPMFGIGQLLASRFMSLWGATDPCQSYGLDNGPMYSGLYTFNNQFGYISVDPENFHYSDYIIVWGANPVENQQRVATCLVQARENGAKIVDIGLLFDGTAGFSDWFVPVKPGSDPYLALAMANYIIENNLYNKEYLLEYSVAPYLVSEETGKFLRDENENYFVWCEKSQEAVAVAPGKSQILAQEPAFTGTYKISGKSYKPAFQCLADHVSQYTLEGAEKITGVPAVDIVKLTEEYVAADKAYIVGALGLRYQNQGESYRAFWLLGTLTGSLGKLGGGVTTSLGCTVAPIAFNNYGITRPLGLEASKMKFVRQKDFFEQVQTGDPYPIKAMIVTSGNPVHNYPSRGRWIETIKAMDLIVDIDIWMTDTGEFADYVLPDCMPFERMEIIDMAAYGHIILQEPAIEPMGEAKDMNYFFTELAKRVGLGEYFDKTTEEWLAIKIQTDYPPIAMIDPPLTMERLKKEKMVPIVWPEELPFDPFRSMDFMTNTGRIEFYSERLVDFDLALPTYVPPLESPVIDRNNEEYPYQFFSGRQRFFMQSMFTNDPLMVELSGKKPSARINPLDANREGINDGDKVEVYNQRGHVIATMRLDEAIPPGTVQVWFGWRQRQFEEGTYAELLTPLGSKYTINEVGDFWYDEAKATYGEDDMANAFATGYAGAWDTIWDCACAVRKIEDGKGA